VQRLVLVSVAIVEDVKDIVDADIWVHYGESMEIGDLVEVGDNFMIPMEDDNEDVVEFYILQC